MKTAEEFLERLGYDGKLSCVPRHIVQTLLEQRDMTRRERDMALLELKVSQTDHEDTRERWCNALTELNISQVDLREEKRLRVEERRYWEKQLELVKRGRDELCDEVERLWGRSNDGAVYDSGVRYMPEEYHGGRVEAFRQGAEKAVYLKSYDISSRYPQPESSPTLSSRVVTLEGIIRYELEYSRQGALSESYQIEAIMVAVWGVVSAVRHYWEKQLELVKRGRDELCDEVERLWDREFIGAAVERHDRLVVVWDPERKRHVAYAHKSEVPQALFERVTKAEREALETLP